ncbi:UNVERIFIED_CONTAM: hypothetical protein RMT77_003800 [Armadillidium vulgare]
MNKILSFQSDGVESPYSWAALPYNISLLSSGMTSLTALSLCIRLYFIFYRNPYSILAIAGEDFTHFLSLSIYTDKIVIMLDSEEVSAPIAAVPGFWNSLCVQINDEESSLKIKINENEFYESINITSVFASPPPLFVLMGQSIIKKNDEYEKNLSFFGKLTEFVLWNHAIGEDGMNFYISCTSEITDSLVHWEPNKMLLNGSVSVKQVSTDVCRSNNTYRVNLTPPLVLPVAKSFCEILKGSFTVEGITTSNSYDAYDAPELLALRSKISYKYLDKKEKNVSNPFKKGWKIYKKLMKTSSISPQIKVSKTTDVGKKEKLVFENRNSSQLPNKRGIRQISDVESIEEGKLIETSELDVISFCDFKKAPILRLNGFCPDLYEVLDETYIVLGEGGEELPFIQGFKGKKITYSRGMWVANSPYSSKYEVWFDEPIVDPEISPMGRHLWLTMITVKEEHSVEDVMLPCDSEYLYLTLSSCPKDYFTCSDGICLPLNLRCDRKADCNDNSDEEQCFKVYVPSENRKDLPCRPLHGENFTNVQLMLQVLEAEIELDIMTLLIEVSLTWKDPSLMYFNLQSDRMSNMVDIEAMNEIFVPKVILMNFLPNTLKCNTFLSFRICSRNETEQLF